jgi:hypothetical protein
MHNKNIMVGIFFAEKALLKSPYVKRYTQRRSLDNDYQCNISCSVCALTWNCNGSDLLLLGQAQNGNTKNYVNFWFLLSSVPTAVFNLFNCIAA